MSEIDFNKIGRCWLEVYEFFRGQYSVEIASAKTLFWFITENPSVGATPYKMIQAGREDKLLKVIKSFKEENIRED